jgi:hypothetical protein
MKPGCFVIWTPKSGRASGVTDRANVYALRGFLFGAKLEYSSDKTTKGVAK